MHIVLDNVDPQGHTALARQTPPLQAPLHPHLQRMNLVERWFSELTTKWLRRGRASAAGSINSWRGDGLWRCTPEISTRPRRAPPRPQAGSGGRYSPDDGGRRETGRRLSIELSGSARDSRAVGSKSSQALALRCRIVLAAAEGRYNREIAAGLGCHPATVAKCGRGSLCGDDATPRRPSTASTSASRRAARTPGCARSPPPPWRRRWCAAPARSRGSATSWGST